MRSAAPLWVGAPTCGGRSLPAPVAFISRKLKSGAEWKPRQVMLPNTCPEGSNFHDVCWCFASFMFSVFGGEALVPRVRVSKGSLHVLVDGYFCSGWNLSLESQELCLASIRSFSLFETIYARVKRWQELLKYGFVSSYYINDILLVWKDHRIMILHKSSGLGPDIVW